MCFSKFLFSILSLNSYAICFNIFMISFSIFDRSEYFISCSASVQYSHLHKPALLLWSNLFFPAIYVFYSTVHYNTLATTFLKPLGANIPTVAELSILSYLDVIFSTFINLITIIFVSNYPHQFRLKKGFIFHLFVFVYWHIFSWLVFFYLHFRFYFCLIDFLFHCQADFIVIHQSLITAVQRCFLRIFQFHSLKMLSLLVVWIVL